MVVIPQNSARVASFGRIVGRYRVPSATSTDSLLSPSKALNYSDTPSPELAPNWSAHDKSPDAAEAAPDAGGGGGAIVYRVLVGVNGSAAIRAAAAKAAAAQKESQKAESVGSPSPPMLPGGGTRRSGTHTWNVVRRFQARQVG